MFSVRRYDPSHASAWDAFARRSKNGLFLFQRGYMDYHADRFTDHSLCFFRDDALFALLPASEKEGELISHGGLTFGGVLSDDRMKAPYMLEIFTLFTDYLRVNRFASLIYKSVPHIYHTIPAQEDSYALFRHDATLLKCEVTSAIGRSHPLPYSDRRTRGIKKARKQGMQFVRSQDYTAYFVLVASLLAEKHQARPTHTHEEMELLAGRFPDNIHLWIAKGQEGRLLAGVIMYLNPEVAHAQYIAANDEGRESGALDALFDHLITTVYPDHAWFDFGISTEQGGRQLNTGLITQKEEFGGRSVAHETWKLHIT